MNNLSTESSTGSKINLNIQDRTDQPAIMIYALNPFSYEYESEDLQRLSCLALLRSYSTMLSSLPESIQNSISFQIISLETVLGIEQNRNGMRLSDQMRCLALNVFSQSDRHLSHSVNAKSLTGFGTAANMELFLKNKDERNRSSYKLYTPPYILSGRIGKTDNADNRSRAVDQSSILYCSYCLSEDQRWLLAVVTDDKGEMMETISINIAISYQQQQQQQQQEQELQDKQSKDGKGNQDKQGHGSHIKQLHDQKHMMDIDMDKPKDSKMDDLKKMGSMDIKPDLKHDPKSMDDKLGQRMDIDDKTLLQQHLKLDEKNQADKKPHERDSHSSGHDSRQPGTDDPKQQQQQQQTSARRLGLQKLMEFIVGVISLSSRPWRIVIGRVGRIGHGELKCWSWLLSKQNLLKTSKQLKDICGNCSLLYPLGGPSILSACLVTMEPDSNLRVLADQITPDERFAQPSMQSQLSTPSDVTCTHILVFPTSAVLQVCNFVIFCGYTKENILEPIISFTFPFSQRSQPFKNNISVISMKKSF